jgi:demethylmenaquinone methyltransferase/2-methoxy-6-polyprenyl-1,4-benzoquinol methylase
MPFNGGEFAFVHTSAALHEMEPEQLEEILKEVYRVLRRGEFLPSWIFIDPLTRFFAFFSPIFAII